MFPFIHTEQSHIRGYESTDDEMFSDDASEPGLCDDLCNEDSCDEDEFYNTDHSRSMGGNIFKICRHLTLI